MFKPKYTITDKLLADIKRVGEIINSFNNQRFPNVVLLEFERIARELSTHTSTSIEGNPLPLTEVKKILKSKPAYIRDTEQEILNYNQALKNLNKKLEKGRIKLSLNLILKIQKQVTSKLLPPSDCGFLRTRPVVINNPSLNKTVYLPPEVSDVKPLTEDLITYINGNRGQIDPLILAGIFHKQMVIIHPFIDGNGRTTRLATKVLLAQMGLNTFNLFSFENYYNNNVTKYFQTVGEYGNYYDLVGEHALVAKIDFTNWLEYFTEGIIDELLRVRNILPKITFSPDTELRKHHQKILEFIKKKGFVKDSDYSKLTDRAKATRALDFQKLINLKIIKRCGKGKATYYILKPAN